MIDLLSDEDSPKNVLSDPDNEPKKRIRTKASLKEQKPPVACASAASSTWFSPLAANFLRFASEQVVRKNDDEEHSDEEREDECWFAQICTKVVGVQHYDGVVSDGENVTMKRQPSNLYDSNALQVLNIRNEQVGHLPREIASTLSPLMDRIVSLRVEGVIPRGSGSAYSIPILIQCFSAPDVVTQCEPAVRRLSDIYCTASRSTPTITTDIRGKIIGSVNSAHATLDNELNQLYAPCEDLQLATSDFIAGTLFPHQQQALYWMQIREKYLTAEEALQQLQPEKPKKKKAKKETTASAFFWTKSTHRKKTVYLNVASNSAFHTPPVIPRGGILADAMGLGKTLSIIALLKGTKPSLIISPLSVIPHWEEQLHQFAPSLSVYTFHGVDRLKDPSKLKEFDVVLSTYHTLANETESTSVFAVDWHRAVLDEAHTIKSHKSKIANACFQIKAEIRWCLTGTPIQNGVQDILSICKFLRIEPFDSFEWFNRLILRPVKQQDTVGLDRLRLLLKYFCLRRTKDQKITIDKIERPIVLLPEKKMFVRKVDFSVDERALYKALFEVAASKIRCFQQANSVQSNYMNILELLLRLRMLCNSPDLIPQKLRDALSADNPNKAYDKACSALGESKAQHLLTLLRDASEDNCCICLEPAGDVITLCSHVFHRPCIELSVKSSHGGASCPLCRSPVVLSNLVSPPEIESSLPKGQDLPSTKITAVLQVLAALRDTPHKVVVFSQFTSFLALLAQSLDSSDDRIGYVKFEGGMSSKERRKAMREFQTDPTKKVILCSLKAAGVGIDMTAADHVILCDPWWNPGVEEQAIDRCHRLGQQKPVTVIRLVTHDTVEEKMLELQSAKQQLADGALDATVGKKGKRNVTLELVSKIFEL